MMIYIKIFVSSFEMRKKYSPALLIYLLFKNTTEKEVILRNFNKLLDIKMLSNTKCVK